MTNVLKPSDIALPSEILCHIEPADLALLPSPYEDFNQVTVPALKPEKIKNIESSLDDTVAIGIPTPATKEEEEALVRLFLSGTEETFRKRKQLDLSCSRCSCPWSTAPSARPVPTPVPSMR